MRSPQLNLAGQEVIYRPRWWRDRAPWVLLTEADHGCRARRYYRTEVRAANKIT